MAKGWEDLKVGFDKKPRMSDLIKMADITRHKKKFRPYRFLGGVVPAAIIWMPIYKDGKPVVGQNGKEVQVPKFVTNYDPQTQTFDETKPCPYVETAEKMNKYLDAKKQINISTVFYANAIDRAIQEAKPRKVAKPSKEERASGFKSSIDSESWTPVEAHQMGTAIASGIQSSTELNTIKSKKTGKTITKPVADERFGCDVMIKYDPDEKGQGKYKVNKGERTPLTDEEKEYLLWDIDGAIAEIKDTRKEAKVEAARMLTEFMKGVKKKSSDDDDDSDDDLPEDVEDTPKKKVTSKKRPKDEDDDDDDVPFDTDDDDDEDEKPVKKKKKKPADDDEDDEDEKPVKKKKKKPVEDDDDDEDEKPIKKKKKPVDDDDDDEDEKPVKKKAKKKPADDDDDDDDSFEDLDDISDEDDDDD